MQPQHIVSLLRNFIQTGTSKPIWSRGAPMYGIAACGNLLRDDLAMTLATRRPLPYWNVMAAGDTQLESLSVPLIQLIEATGLKCPPSMLYHALESLGKTGGAAANDFIVEFCYAFADSATPGADSAAPGEVHLQAMVMNAFAESATRMSIDPTTGIFEILVKKVDEVAPDSEFADFIHVMSAIAEARGEETPTPVLQAVFHDTPLRAHNTARHVALNCVWLAPMIAKSSVLGDGFDHAGSATVDDLLFLSPPFAPLRALPSVEKMRLAAEQVRNICTFALESADAGQRLRATMMLAKLGDQVSVARLIDIVKNDGGGADKAWHCLVDLLRMQARTIESSLAEFLASSAYPSGMTEPTEAERSWISAYAGVEASQEECAQYLLELLSIRTKIIESLGKPEPDSAVKDKNSLRYVDTRHHISAIGSLGTATTLKYHDKLIDLLPFLAANVRVFATGALAALDDRQVDAKLSSYLVGETSPLVHLAAEHRNTLIKFYDI